MTLVLVALCDRLNADFDQVSAANR